MIPGPSSAAEVELITLRRELAEANAEIARHHADFERIRALAANWEGAWGANSPMSDGIAVGFNSAARAIRDIVG